MFFHWSNENDKPGGRQGSILRHGRAWLHLGARDRERTTIKWCWAFGRMFCDVHADVHQGDGLGLSFNVSIPILGGFYLTLDGPPFSVIARWLLKRVKHYEDREIDVSFHGWALFWSFWNNPMEWSRNTPRWRHGSFNVLDFLFGKWKYSDRELHSEQAVVPMPEGSYPARVILSEVTWKRPRWFTRRALRAEVKITDKRGIPHPGKGENSWDCGEDGTMGLTCGETTVEGAIAAMVETCLRNRRRYGGSVMWKSTEREGRAS